MLNTKDQENLTNVIYAAKLLTQNLGCLVKSTNPLLVDISIEILQQAEQIEQRLKRIESIIIKEQKDL
jgi:hypothetical protein